MNDNMLRDDCEKFGKKFFLDTLKMCKENEMSLGCTLHTMQQKIKLCQVLMFGLMAEIRTEESIATIYADMKGMCLESLDKLIEHPELFTNFGAVRDGGPEKSVTMTVELFEGLRDARVRGIVAIK